MLTLDTYKPEPVLDEGEYQNILDIRMNMALVMERSPSAFTTIDEEDLRQHFLVQLNGQYEGQVTGETFNCQGKIDILVRADGKNILWPSVVKREMRTQLTKYSRTSAGAIRGPPSSSYRRS